MDRLTGTASLNEKKSNSKRNQVNTRGPTGCTCGAMDRETGVSHRMTTVNRDEE